MREEAGGGGLPWEAPEGALLPLPSGILQRGGKGEAGTPKAAFTQQPPWLSWALTFVPWNCLDWETLPGWFPLHSIVQMGK